MSPNPKKLKRTIITYFVLANILIGLIGFGGASYSFYRQLSALTLDKLGQTASARADAISEWLRLAIIVGTQPSRQAWGKITLENYYNSLVSRGDLIETTARVIDGALTYNHDIKGMARLDRDGKGILHRGQEIPPSYRPDLSPERTSPQVSFHTEVGGRPQLIVASPLHGRGGDLLGVDIVLLDTDPLMRLLAEPSFLDQKSITYMTDINDGLPRLIYSSEGDHDSRLADDLSAMIDAALKTDSRAVSGQGLACGVGLVVNADWQIAVVVDKSLLMKPLNEQIKLTIAYFLVFFIFALLGLWFLALRPLTGRVEKTTDALEEEVEETAEKLLRESEGRKKSESRLVVAKHRADVAREAKSQFLANLSHEIRTPLNAVIGMTDLTLYTDLNEEQHSYLTEVKKAAAHLLEQINDLLDLSKLQDGLMVTESKAFNLKTLVEQMVRNYAMVGRNKGLSFILDLDGNISPHRLGDPFRLRQVLNYLLDNAFKFTTEGEVILKVSPEPDDGQKTDLIRFEVSDSGVGIEAGRLETIFDPFVQADASLTRSSGGTGMGLAVSKRLVELMGGDMSVESTLGQGSSFKIIVGLPPAPEFEEEDRAPLTADDLRGLKAVMADDNEVNRRILSGYLNHWGFEVHCFENGLQALDFLRKSPSFTPDVFIMDVIMPGLEPKELEKALRSGYPSTPVIFLSSIESSVIESEAADNPGQTLTIGKPVDQNELRDYLARLLSGNKRKPEESKASSEKLAAVENPLDILVVDDNQLNRRLASTLLAKRGHRVDEAENGQEALNAISGKKYDMVFMDIQMPVMDGLSAVREIRSKPEKYGRDLPIVAMTAHALPGDQELFLNSGMTAYISKPFKPQELLAAAESDYQAGNHLRYDGGKTVAAELNRAAILENFMDDEELLFESIGLFLERIDARMVSLREAVAAKNPDLFMPEAHTIKGMIGIFSTEKPFEAAKKLELKGREKTVEGIEEDLAELEKEVEALSGALRDWRAGN